MSITVIVKRVVDLNQYIYMKKHTNNLSRECSTGVQQEAVERYQKLCYTDKAIYRAIGKEYFRKKVV